MRKITLAAIFLIAAPFIFSGSIANATDYSSAPSDVSSMQGTIEKSLVGIHCTTSDSVGFAGNYSLSTDEKNRGINSAILTTATGIQGCRFRNSTVTLSYQGKNYDGTSYFWNGQSPDLALIETTLNVPTLPLYGSNLPQAGDWVDVVENIPGFGFKWIASKIEAVNPQTLQIAIDALSPSVVNNALVFDNQGTFIGVLTNFGLTAPAGMQIVEGAPLQCQFSKSQSTPTISVCGKTADQIWTSNTSGGTANSNSQAISDLARMVNDAIAAFTASNSAYTQTENSCDALIDTSNSAGSELFGNLENLKLCHQYDAKMKQDSDSILSIQNQTAVTDSTQAQHLVDMVNSLIDDSNSNSDNLDQAFQSISLLVQAFSPLKDQLDSDSSNWQNLISKINSLPNVLKSSLSSQAMHSQANSYYSKLVTDTKQLLAVAQSFQTIDNLNELQSLQSQVNSLNNDASIPSFENSYSNLLKGLPNAFCVNGKNAYWLKNGAKCQRGFTKSSFITS